jgi:hypothetical protein
MHYLKYIVTTKCSLNYQVLCSLDKCTSELLRHNR